MKKEKAKKLKENELNDSELDQVAGGKAKYSIPQGGRCPLCGTICFNADELTYIDIGGVSTRVCVQCAGAKK